MLLKSFGDIFEPFSLSNKRILVTGASSGIGSNIAVACSKAGGTVILTSRSRSKLEETYCKLLQGEHAIHPADLSRIQDINKLANEMPSVDCVVLNAGIGNVMPVKYIKDTIVDELFDVNIKGSIKLIHHILKNNKIHDGGSVCFISSVASLCALYGNSIYSATKGAVNSFTKSLALELAIKGIRVNAILPGLIQTEFLKESAIDSEELDKHIKNYPLGRFGKPVDVAYLVLFLLSDASAWMTGSLITLDGGYSLK